MASYDVYECFSGLDLSPNGCAKPRFEVGVIFVSVKHVQRGGAMREQQLVPVDSGKVALESGAA